MANITLEQARNGSKKQNLRLTNGKWEMAVTLLIKWEANDSVGNEILSFHIQYSDCVSKEVAHIDLGVHRITGTESVDAASTLFLNEIDSLSVAFFYGVDPGDSVITRDQQYIVDDFVRHCLGADNLC